MKRILTILFIFLSVFTYGQVQPPGTILGNQTVIELNFVRTWGAPDKKQALVYMPPEYNQAGNENKKYPLFVFLHGAGQGTSSNISEVLGTSLPQLISQGLNPVSVDSVTGETVPWLVVSLHAANTYWSWSGYDVQIQVADFISKYRVDTSCVWVGGLSAGGAGAWSMWRTFRTPVNPYPRMPLTGVVILSTTDYQGPGSDAQMIESISGGRSMISIVGTNDGGSLGNNRAYSNIFRTYQKPEPPRMLWENERPGLTHESAVWNPPFQLSNRWLNPSRNMWDLMWSKRLGAPAEGVITAFAGSDAVVNMPTTSVNLNGSASTPSGTTITSYAWTRVSGPNTPSINNANTQNATVTGMVAGTYVFRLTVTNSASNSANDDVQIIVNPQPTVSAGSDQVINQPTSQVALAGTSSKPGGSIASRLWTKISGPSTFNIVSPTANNTNVTGLTQAGVYVFRYTATDNLGGTNSDDVQITVNPSGANSIRVVDMAPTEYRNAYLYTDGYVRRYKFTGGVGTVLDTFNVDGNKKIIKLAAGFNSTLMVAEDNTLYLSRPNTNFIITRITPDTNNVVINDVTDCFGYFYDYTFIRADGSLWYFGNDDYNLFPGLLPITKPLQLSPNGMQVKKVSMGKKIVVLTTNGQVWERTNGSTSWVQKTLPRPAVDIVTGYEDFSIAIVPKVDGSQVMGYPYAWGNAGQYWGGTAFATVTTPVSLTAWNVTVPIKVITASSNAIHWIDSLGRRFSIGDNGNGEIGNGQEKYNKQEIWQYPYSGKWHEAETPQDYPSALMVSTPYQHPAPGPGRVWKNIWGGRTFSFYVWASDDQDSLYFNGRDKSLVGAFGLQLGNESVYPNGLDVVTPARRTPLLPTAYRYPTFVPYSVSAANDKTINVDNTLLAASGTASYAHINGDRVFSDTIKAWQWFQLAGPNTALMGSPTSDQTTISNLVNGLYRFRVQMRDNRGGSISDTVEITVNIALANIPPVANAGPDRTVVIPLAADSIKLNGTLSYDQGGTITYLWTKISGPTDGSVLVNPTNAESPVSSLKEGTYVFRLTVTDTDGATNSDDVTINIVSYPTTPSPGSRKFFKLRF